MFRLGLDLGGTKIEGVLLDEEGNTLKRLRVPTLRENGYQSIVNRICELTNNLLKKSKNIKSIGICTPGSIDPTSGRLKISNTVCLINKPLKQDLEQKLGLQVHMENDANCFALAEAVLGAGRDYGIVFGVILGTGVGGGIVINGKIHRGPNNMAGEWGHHVLYSGGNKCYCGNRGCVETYISGPALEKQWLGLSGEIARVSEIGQANFPVQYAEWKRTFVFNYGQSLAHIITILDPDIIIIGGGVSNVDFLYDEGKKAVYEKVSSPNILTPILKNTLGDSAGVYGAAMLGELA